MALQQDLILDSGISVSNAYIRVDSISGNKDCLTLVVNSYVSKENYNSNKVSVKREIFSFAPSIIDTSSNFIKQGYEYLKTLPEFNLATNILETSQTS